MAKLGSEHALNPACTCRAWCRAARDAVLSLGKTTKPEDMARTVQVFPYLRELTITSEGSNFIISDSDALSYELVKTCESKYLTRLTSIGIARAMTAAAVAARREQLYGRVCFERLVELCFVGRPLPEGTDPGKKRPDTTVATSIRELGLSLPCLRVLTLENPDLGPPQLNPAPLQHYTTLRELRLGGTVPERVVRLARSAPGLQHLVLEFCKIMDLAALGDATLRRLKTLELVFCKSLQSLPPGDSLSGLDKLHVEGCPALLPALDFKQLQGLRRLHLRGTDDALRFIWPCVSLRSVTVRDAGGIALRPSITQLAQIKCLDLGGDDALTSLPLGAADTLLGISSLNKVVLSAKTMQLEQNHPELQRLQSAARARRIRVRSG